MTDTNTTGAPIPGAVQQFDHPNWEPLLGLVGDGLASWFMWMTELQLADGTAVHAYKHRDTRRYLHIAEDGRCFAYVAPPLRSDEPDAYRPITRSEAIEEPLGPWQFNFIPAGERREIAALIDTARRIAERGETITVEPAWLEAQRAFEEQQRAVEEREAA